MPGRPVVQGAAAQWSAAMAIQRNRNGGQKKPGQSAPEQQRQEENGDAATVVAHVP
jgi:hypothetical protein